MLTTTIMSIYYLAESASGQPERARRAYVARLRFPTLVPHISFIDQACSVKVIGYWPPSSFTLPLTSTSSRSRKENKQELCLHLVILTSRLVNNAYLLIIRSTPDISNPRLLEPRANSNQNRFPLDFRHTFTVLLPSVTRTLDNSNSRELEPIFVSLQLIFYIILPAITRTMF